MAGTLAAVSALEIAGMLAYLCGAIPLAVLMGRSGSSWTWTAAIPFITGLLCWIALGRWHAAAT